MDLSCKKLFTLELVGCCRHGKLNAVLDMGDSCHQRLDSPQTHPLNFLLAAKVGLPFEKRTLFKLQGLMLK